MVTVEEDGRYVQRRRASISSVPVPQRIDRVKTRLHDCSDGSRRAYPSRARDEGANYQALSYFSFTSGSSSSGTKNWVWPQEPQI